MNSTQTAWLFGLTVIGMLLILAVLPTLIAIARGADELMLIILVNVLACATVIGWPVALIMAMTWPRRYPRPGRGRSSPSARPQHHDARTTRR
ncbi:superinfection immunity protein [Actinomadura fibrosa]|uniref:Superinfection immunity protein n=1 Tax=Actinomadura fibrosa TaxID=111802 RepID=A0ABW2XXX5_9ACTN|nr:superinfection immunity protein [Actinomadura fibrosa]